jgi:lipopolysaccharide transport system permease protein
MLRNLRELYQYRALVWNLTQRELKARYRNSILGFLWTFLNPALQALVYGIFFTLLTQQSIAAYPYFMFVGLLPWIWFSSSILAGTSCISDRRDLLTKVRFPAQVLPATVVTSNLINYALSLPVLIALGGVFGQWPSWHVVVLPLVVAVQLLFTLALTYFFSALNVRFRDLQHILGNVVMLWFFMTPIAYQIAQVPAQYRQATLLANPMAVLVTAYQAIFYEHHLPDPQPLLVLAAGALALLWISAIIFEGRREEFAEVA